jgi:redox-sensitive bicupin YhaK (pirin superfamily)
VTAGAVRAAWIGFPLPPATCHLDTGTVVNPIRATLEPRPRDLGGFIVRRVLPAGRLRMVGPFIFFDQMGPRTFAPGEGLEVRPHPHIGLATVTYLFDGEIIHRDSLGFVQPIRPGDVNWMIAGRGIAHSERTGSDTRATGSELHGIQSWIALPQAHEETAPSFAHHPATTLPAFERGGALLRLIVGRAWGHESPVKVHSPVFYADASLPAAAALDLPDEHAERAVYVVEGEVEVAGQPARAGQMHVLAAGASAVLTATARARVMLLGGAPLDGERHIWWNFVSSSEERIARAKDDWRAGRFAPVPGDPDFIPLPDD